MQAMGNNGYVPGALLLNKKIREVRSHIEYEKFIARMLVDNDDTRDFKTNTADHVDSLHTFLYNNDAVDKFTMRGKNEILGTSAYIPPEEDRQTPTPSGVH